MSISISALRLTSRWRSNNIKWPWGIISAIVRVRRRGWLWVGSRGIGWSRERSCGPLSSRCSAGRARWWSPFRWICPYLRRSRCRSLATWSTSLVASGRCIWRPCRRRMWTRRACALWCLACWAITSCTTSLLKTTTFYRLNDDLWSAFLYSCFSLLILFYSCFSQNIFALFLCKSNNKFYINFWYSSINCSSFLCSRILSYYFLLNKFLI